MGSHMGAYRIRPIDFFHSVLRRICLHSIVDHYAGTQTLKLFTNGRFTIENTKEDIDLSIR